MNTNSSNIANLRERIDELQVQKGELSRLIAEVDEKLTFLHRVTAEACEYLEELLLTNLPVDPSVLRRVLEQAIPESVNINARRDRSNLKINLIFFDDLTFEGNFFYIKFNQ